jgi:uncharacterized protein (TIGR02145 family)
MKKILTFLLGIILLTGCTKDDKAEVVPAAPENLTGEVISTSAIDLMWTDRSTNETGFKIERKIGSGTYSIVGTTATDITSFNDANLTSGTTYTYRVYSNNSVGNSLTYSNELTITTKNIINLPTMTTTAVSSITQITATSGGNISNDGGAAITAKGVCWSTSSNPTISLPTKTNDGTATGVFTSSISGLTANTTYYVRSYATNSIGTTYGTELIFSTLARPTAIDVDGNSYPLITICNQTWTQNNLNVSHYRNGDIIPQVTDSNQWITLTTGAWCYYFNISSYGIIYGKIYNWYAVNDPRGLAPAGYHIPSDAEWSTMINCLDPSANGGASNSTITNIAGGAMKETGTVYWSAPNTGATNSSGFKGLGGGSRSEFGSSWGTVRDNTHFWSTTELITNKVMIRYLVYGSGTVGKAEGFKISGSYVRCIKD